MPRDLDTVRRCEECSNYDRTEALFAGSGFCRVVHEVVDGDTLVADSECCAKSFGEHDPDGENFDDLGVTVYRPA